MKLLVVGAGVQGKKRANVAGSEFFDFLDPEVEFARYKNLEDLVAIDYDAVAICTPNSVKAHYIDYFIEKRKDILVEKPFLCNSPETINQLRKKAQLREVVLYTAYNHRFEPAISLLRDKIREQQIGKLYFVRLIYGNGTARLVRDSNWRDTGLGVIEDLVPHLVDILYYWFPDNSLLFTLINSSHFENAAPDHAILKGSDSQLLVSLEVSLCSWKNSFVCDIYGENGSMHINGLCKWGKSEVKIRQRVIPSGIPLEETITYPSGDPTWSLEYEHFKNLVNNKACHDDGVDFKIQKILSNLEKSSLS